MLVWSSLSPTARVGRLVGALAAACLLPAVWYSIIRLAHLEWPRATNIYLVGLGVAAAAIIAFEMLIGVRKRFRGRRLGATKQWTRWHIWLGIACLPLGVMHSAFGLGGTLTATLMALFVAVVFSGVWGLCLQQWLPGKLLREYPNETVAGEADAVMQALEPEIEGHIHALDQFGPEDAIAARKGELKPFLLKGKSSRTFGSAPACEAAFAGWKREIPVEESKLLDSANRLELMCLWRREWAGQRRIQFWLHSWLAVHLPLSLALCVLLALHVFVALKMW